jgi:hypothetical protein
MILRIAFIALALLITQGSTAKGGIVFDDFSTIYGMDSLLGGATGIVTPSGAQMTRSSISNSGTNPMFYEFTLPPSGASTDDATTFIQYHFADSLHSLGGPGLEIFTLPVDLTGGSGLNIAVSTLDEDGNSLTELYEGQPVQSISSLVSSDAYGIRIEFTLDDTSTNATIAFGGPGSSFTAAVPEPTSCFMFGTLMAFGFIRRRSA